MIQLNKIKDAIILNIKIEEIISEYINLKIKGRNFFAICPFHDDTNPSLSVSPEKKIFRCFTCNVSGDVISFVMKYNNINYIEALKILGNKIGYNLVLDEKNKTTVDIEKDKIFNLNKDALIYFQYNLMLKSNKKIRQYLIKDRNLLFENIYDFNLGWASNNNKLCDYLVSLGYKISDIEKAGLVLVKNGKVIDFFYNRIIFTIRDSQKNILGFSGRSLLTNSEMKYLNIKSNFIFSKSKTLYNIDNALAEIRKKQTIIIVEGYMDVISLYNLGIYNVVSLMGTALTSDQIILIKSLAKKIILFFDGDEPGIEANFKTAFILLKNNLEVQIINNDTNYDPNELVKFNVDKLISYINNPVDCVNYLISKTKIDTEQNINKFIQRKELLLAAIKNNKINWTIIQNKLNKFIEQKIPNYQKNVPMIIKNNNFKKNNSKNINSINDLLFSQLILSKKAFDILLNNLTEIQLNDIQLNYLKFISQIYKISDKKDKISNIDKLINNLNDLSDEKQYFIKLNEYIYQNKIQYNENCINDIINSLKQDRKKQIILETILNDNNTIEKQQELIKNQK